MERYLRHRTALIATARPGLPAARQLSALTDVAVARLAHAAPPPPGRWAVCALGGWGAGALLPDSDLDLLVLAEAPERRLKPFVEAVLYPLWDAGLAVGHQVRSPKSHVQACRGDDLATLTASLTARVVAGDVVFGAEVLGRVARNARSSRRTVLRALAERQRPGSPFLLEPHLKEGAGGRRDHDELVWTAATVSGSVASDPDALVDAGFMTPGEAALVEDAADAVAEARWRLQACGAGDVLRVDEGPTFSGPDAERLQRALAATWLVLNEVRRRTAGEGAATDTILDGHALFELLDRGGLAAEALQEAACRGRLDGIVPGFRDLMTVRRPGLGHTLTVGAHSIAAAVGVGEFAADAGSLGRSNALITDKRALQIAALTHDAGKSAPGPGHADRGVPVALHAARATGLLSDSATTAGELVRLHLALVETALHEDTENEDVILRCAGRIARRDLVAPLHLLTAADTRATGPSAWTPWLDAVIAGLVARVDAALSPDVDGAGLVTRATAVRAAALSTLPRAADAQRAFVESAPVRYLASRTAEEALRDARLVSGLAAASAEGARIAVGAGPTDDTRAVTVAAWDRPRLLSQLAGAIALAGLDVLAFDAHGVTGRVALDSFVVRSATARPLTPDVFARLERLVTAALKDRYELATRLAERRRHYPPSAAVEPRVEIAQSGWDTAVRIVAADRPGLLHDIAAAVAASGLDVRRARARTVDGIARDSFHVVGPDGARVDDDGALGHLSMRLREVL